jgi:hypothetical protein
MLAGILRPVHPQVNSPESCRYSTGLETHALEAIDRFESFTRWTDRANLARHGRNQDIVTSGLAGRCADIADQPDFA